MLHHDTVSTQSTDHSNEDGIDRTSASSVPEQFDEGILGVPLDVLKYVMSFCSSKDIALLSATCRSFRRVTKLLQLDAVTQIASFNKAKNRYEIRNITLMEKTSSNIRLDDMTIAPSKTSSTLQFLLTNCGDYSDGKWARFNKCDLRRVSKSDCNGYWKVYSTKEDGDDSTCVPVADLNTIRSLLLHPVVARITLDYTLDIPFQDPINVYIDDSNREYELSFWNGADFGQSTAIQLTCLCNQTGVSDELDTLSDTSADINTYSFIHCQTSPHQIRWQWYDNNAAIYKDYALGPEVDAQLEVSFQANLHFPASLGRFSNVNFNTFKEAIIPLLDAKEAAIKRRRHFLLRFRFLEDVLDEFDEMDGHRVYRQIRSVEQIAVHPRPYCTFPRIVRRLRKSSDSTKEDEVDYDRCSRRLRMAPSR